MENSVAELHNWIISDVLSLLSRTRTPGGLQILLMMHDDSAVVELAFLFMGGLGMHGQVELLHAMAAARPEECQDDAPFNARLAGPLFAGLVDCLESNSQEACLQVMGLCVLSLCLHHDGDHAQARRDLAMCSGVLATILNGMRAHEASPEVQSAGCTALKHLLHAETLASSVPGLICASEEGALEIVAHAKKAHPGNASVAESASYVLEMLKLGQRWQLENHWGDANTM